MTDPLPLGKLPADLLADLLARHPITDPRVVVGPRPGEDAAVLDIGDRYLITKTDPITFATDEIGWYAVNVNANDIAATGGTPAWFMATVLLPGGQATGDTATEIFEQIVSACGALNVSLVGGHTEITYGIDRPIVVGAMLGLAEKSDVLTTGGAQPGDRILVSKGFPIEATAIIAREKAEMLSAHFDADFLARCAGYLHDPGISVVGDAMLARQHGRVHALHDPTEGGLATGLWEMAEASGVLFVVSPETAVLEDARRICEAVGLDPLGAIASGALLMSVHAGDVDALQAAFAGENLPLFDIGYAEAGQAGVVSPQGDSLPRPPRDEIAKLFD